MKKLGAWAAPLLIAAWLAPRAQAQAQAKPAWFDRDYKSTDGWGFFCEGEGATEEAALTGARAACAAKICQLFGVEVDYQTKTTETLQSTGVETTVLERCPKVRVVGRKEKRKTVSCEETLCRAHVEQVYPRAEYDREHERLNRPAISKVLERTIVVRENGKTFRDPKECREALSPYPAIRGERPEDSERRAAVLDRALPACRDLDYRDVPLQTELSGYLIASFSSREPGVAVRLSQLVGTAATLEARLLALRDHERAQKDAAAQATKLAAWIRTEFDALAFRPSSFDPKLNRWRLVNGKLSEKDPYVAELGSCQKQGQLLVRWPAELWRDLRVCASETSSECATFSRLGVRLGFLGCICRRAAHADTTACARTLEGHLTDACPKGLGAECFRAFAKLVAERMKVDGI